jgi:hypothetical protein
MHVQDARMSDGARGAQISLDGRRQLREIRFGDQRTGRSMSQGLVYVHRE